MAASNRHEGDSRAPGSQRRARRTPRLDGQRLDARIRRIVREELADLRDVLASEAALAEGRPVSAAEVWRRLGL